MSTQSERSQVVRVCHSDAVYIYIGASSRQCYHTGFSTTPWDCIDLPVKPICETVVDDVTT
jgi:hypothetical protein